MSSYNNIVNLVVANETTGLTQLNTDKHSKCSTHHARSDPKNKI